MPTSTELEALHQLRDLYLAKHTRQFQPLGHQIPPDGDWRIWMMLAGRGAGKTDGAAGFVTDHIQGPPCFDGEVPHRVAVIAPTIGDAVEACAKGPSGLLSHDPTARLSQSVDGVIVTWRNGSRARMFGTHTPNDIERLRAGGNTCLWWGDEFAAWRHLDDAWQVGRPGLRHGTALTVLTTTPKRRRLLIKLLSQSNVATTAATMFDNPHLPDHVKDDLRIQYEGTSIGRQELYGELLEDVDGALWTLALIDQHRMHADQLPQLRRIVTGVDPQGSKGTGMTGIVAAAIGPVDRCPCNQNQDRLPHGYVLEDSSLDGTPAEWATQAIHLHRRLDGDRIVAERNFGGDMVEQTIRNVDASVPVDIVNASRGKHQRAEPIAALYEQGRIHHVGGFPQLEDEMTTWTIDESWSPNRLDALVWALTELGLSSWRPARISTSARTRRI